MIGPDYDYFARLVHQRSGLVLGPEKTYLVQQRLDPIARELSLAHVPALLGRLRLAPEPLLRRCVEAMATHESLFFRDGAPFEQLSARILPELCRTKAAGEPIRVWCAACSSGQEPYSIAILVREAAGLLQGRRVEITATDLSEGVLHKARTGLYSDFETARGLSPERRARWFRPAGAQWQAADELRALVSFRRHNLLDPPLGLGLFDVVLCRNVLIYFDRAHKAQALEAIARSTAPEGVLFLGSAETVVGLTEAFEPLPAARGVYRLRNAAPARLAG